VHLFAAVNLDESIDYVREVLDVSLCILLLATMLLDIVLERTAIAVLHDKEMGLVPAIYLHEAVHIADDVLVVIRLETQRLNLGLLQKFSGLVELADKMLTSVFASQMIDVSLRPRPDVVTSDI
jgi:hypothetical protein